MNTSLPISDLLTNSFSFLDETSLCRVEQCSKEWKNIVGTKGVWRRICQEQHGIPTTSLSWKRECQLYYNWHKGNAYLRYYSSRESFLLENEGICSLFHIGQKVILKNLTKKTTSTFELQGNLFNGLYNIKISPQYIFFLVPNNTIEIFDRKSQQPIWSFPIPVPVRFWNCLYYKCNDHFIASNEYNGASISIWDIRNQRQWGVVNAEILDLTESYLITRKGQENIKITDLNSREERFIPDSQDKLAVVKGNQLLCFNRLPNNPGEYSIPIQFLDIITLKEERRAFLPFPSLGITTYMWTTDTFVQGDIFICALTVNNLPGTLLRFWNLKTSKFLYEKIMRQHSRMVSVDKTRLVVNSYSDLLEYDFTREPIDLPLKSRMIALRYKVSDLWQQIFTFIIDFFSRLHQQTRSLIRRVSHIY